MSYKDELLGELNAGYTAFKEALAGLGDDQMTVVWLGDWSLRDILAHVAGWHREMTGGLERLARGERPTPEGVDYSDSDRWNAGFAAAKKSLSPREMVADLDASFQGFESAATALPEERFEKGRTVDRMLHTSGIDHYIEHGDQIKDWRKRL